MLNFMINWNVRIFLYNNNSPLTLPTMTKEAVRNDHKYLKISKHYYKCYYNKWLLFTTKKLL